MQIKKLKKLDKIVHNPSEKKCERFMEIFQIEELLGWSKCNVYQVFFQFLLKNEFLNINLYHVLNTWFHIFLMLCRERQWRNIIPSEEDKNDEGCKWWWWHISL